MGAGRAGQEDRYHLAIDFPPEQLQYVEVFQRRTVTAAEFASHAPSLARSDEAIIAELDSAGIRASLISGFDEH